MKKSRKYTQINPPRHPGEPRIAVRGRPRGPVPHSTRDRLDSGLRRNDGKKKYAFIRGQFSGEPRNPKFLLDGTMILG